MVVTKKHGDCVFDQDLGMLLPYLQKGDKASFKHGLGVMATWLQVFLLGNISRLGTQESKQMLRRYLGIAGAFIVAAMTTEMRNCCHEQNVPLFAFCGEASTDCCWLRFRMVGMNAFSGHFKVCWTYFAARFFAAPVSKRMVSEESVTVLQQMGTMDPRSNFNSKRCF